ncbi:uncharacterized protein LOC128555937 [Mercenaria mercenaria]|uniref:uncharacterized protein LOC128555937 n=1 Tax=Mercenaria mercenaria TaxID=6596 RepID=UPI00234E382C|nr:uncharacterized protein LOC128555937 [Mercenaria mercenaria]
MADRQTLWKVLRHYGIPDKIVRVIQGLYKITKCQVIHNSALSPSFSVQTGVRRGCLLSPLIFSVFIDWIMKTSMTPPRGIQWTLSAKLGDIDFADDFPTIVIFRKRGKYYPSQTGLAFKAVKEDGMSVYKAARVFVHICNLRKPFPVMDLTPFLQGKRRKA